jgi:hypothetical protein
MYKVIKKSIPWLHKIVECRNGIATIHKEIDGKNIWVLQLISYLLGDTKRFKASMVKTLFIIDKNEAVQVNF